jgi:iron(III) transport system ATP-binding protein
MVVDVQHLTKSYDGSKQALSDCTFRLEAGKIGAIVGESGSGKTTLLRLIAGLERPESGTIHLNNQVVTSDQVFVTPQKRQLGFVFQDYALFPHLTVRQNIAFGLKKDKVSIIQNVLERTKMLGYENVYPHQLSGGPQQRIALARTLAQQPKLLLLDEPFSNLDARLKSTLRQEIKTIVEDLGTSMIFITHDIVDALEIAESILLLKQGHVVTYDTLKGFCQNSRNDDVRNIISDLKQTTQQVRQFLKNKKA